MNENIPVVSEGIIPYARAEKKSQQACSRAALSAMTPSSLPALVLSRCLTMALATIVQSFVQ